MARRPLASRVTLLAPRNIYRRLTGRRPISSHFFPPAGTIGRARAASQRPGHKYFHRRQSLSGQWLRLGNIRRPYPQNNQTVKDRSWGRGYDGATVGPAGAANARFGAGSAILDGITAPPSAGRWDGARDPRSGSQERFRRF